jgi:uncharacterized membrane protein YdjX (TVP38/TMEM64 family)
MVGVENYLNKLYSLGEWVAIFITFLESFLPFLPLIAFIISNSIYYGLFLGGLLSWLGIICGALCIFLLSHFLRDRVLKRLITHNKFKKIFDYIENKGLPYLIIFSAIPGTPSFLIHVIAGLTRMTFIYFLIGVGLGKAILVFLVSYMGTDLFTLHHNPLKMIFILILIIIFWFLGKWLDKKI